MSDRCTFAALWWTEKSHGLFDVPLSLLIYSWIFCWQAEEQLLWDTEKKEQLYHIFTFDYITIHFQSSTSDRFLRHSLYSPSLFDFSGLVSWCIPEQKNKQKTRCDVELTASLHRKTSRVSVASCSSSFISRTNWRSWTPRAAHHSFSCVLFNQLHLKLYQSNQSENTQHKYYYNYSVFYRKEERDSHFMAVVIGSWKWWFWRQR